MEAAEEVVAVAEALEAVAVEVEGRRRLPRWVEEAVQLAVRGEAARAAALAAVKAVAD